MIYLQFVFFLIVIGFLLCLFGSLYEEYLVNKEIGIRKWSTRFTDWLFWLFKDI